MSDQVQGQWTKQDLMEVAKWQKNILWMILLSFEAMFVPLATIVVGIAQIYFIYEGNWGQVLHYDFFKLIKV